MIFIDAGPFIAKCIVGDNYREAAMPAWGELVETAERCVTSSWVLAEAVTYIGRKTDNVYAARQARKMFLSKDLLILRPDESDEYQAVTWFEKFADQRVSFTDCVSFVLLRKHKISRVFTFDRHFEAAGFKIWPKRNKGE